MLLVRDDLRSCSKAEKIVLLASNECATGKLCTADETRTACVHVITMAYLTLEEESRSAVKQYGQRKYLCIQACQPWTWADCLWHA